MNLHLAFHHSCDGHSLNYVFGKLGGVYVAVTLNDEVGTVRYGEIVSCTPEDLNLGLTGEPDDYEGSIPWDEIEAVTYQ